MLNQKAGLKPNFRLADDRGRDFDCAMTAVDYVDGKARYVACIPNGVYGRTLKSRLTVPVAGHLYECRTGRYLGTTGEVVDVLSFQRRASRRTQAQGRATPDWKWSSAKRRAIFSPLPYQVQRLDVACARPRRVGPADRREGDGRQDNCVPSVDEARSTSGT